MNKPWLFPISHPTRDIYEERIARYMKVFRSHEDYYFQSTLAQKFLRLQADNEAIQSRIKACEDEIALKRKEMEQLSGMKQYHQYLLWSWCIIYSSVFHSFKFCLTRSSSHLPYYWTTTRMVFLNNNE